MSRLLLVVLLLTSLLAILVSAQDDYYSDSPFTPRGPPPPGCPSNVWGLHKPECEQAALGGCPVEHVGRGCMKNCNTRPLGCQNMRKRYGDGGCKPKGTCNFKCREKCDSFAHRCHWVKGKGCLKKRPL